MEVESDGSFDGSVWREREGVRGEDNHDMDVGINEYKCFDGNFLGFLMIERYGLAESNGRMIVIRINSNIKLDIA